MRGSRGRGSAASGAGWACRLPRQPVAPVEVLPRWEQQPKTSLSFLQGGHYCWRRASILAKSSASQRCGRRLPVRNHYTNHSGSPNEECTQSDAAPITLRAAADANQSISTWACASEKRAASARAGLTPMILKFTPWMSGFVSDGSGPARIAPRVGEVSAARRLRRAERGEGGGARDQCCTQRFQMVTGLRIIRCFCFVFVARCCCGGLFAWAAGSNAVTFCETCDDD